MAEYSLCTEEGIPANDHLLLDLKMMVETAWVVGSGVKLPGGDCF